MQTEDDFKLIARLRWELDEDRTPIARTTSRRNRKDHLYFHGPGVLGWYIERPTKRRFQHALKQARIVLGARRTRETIGDFDGVVLFRCSGPSEVPASFLRRKPKGIAAKVQKGAP